MSIPTKLSHHAAVVDTDGRRLGEQGFAASASGYADVLAWARSFGPVTIVGVESTGSYGAGLARALLVAGIDLYEVNGPEKISRVKHGKSDPVDAYSAAEQVRTAPRDGAGQDHHRRRRGTADAESPA